MRMLILSQVFYPSKVGGPSNTLYWLSKGLLRKDVQVSVVASNNFLEGVVNPDVWLNVDGIKVRYCTAKSKLPFRVIWNGCKQVFNHDVILLCSICYLPSIFIALLALLLRKKIIWSPRGELFPSAINNNRGKILYMKMLRFILSKRTLFHATSEEEKEMIKYYFGTNVNVVIIPNYLELDDRMEPSSHDYFLYIGRLAPIKALDNLLGGLVRSRKFEKSHFKFLMVGKKDLDYYQLLKSIIDDNASLKNKVCFIDAIGGEEKNRMYANAYFTFLVSHSENFGNVVVESLAQGTPVVASKGTPWQILSQSKSGFWIANDADSIAKKIDDLIDLDANAYSSMRGNAYNLAQKYDVFENIDVWLNVLNKICYVNI